jgi:hypothetical protein
MELFRTNQLPESITPSSFHYCTGIKDEISRQALSVYNNVYRDPKLSQFVLLDTGRPDLEGCMGTVTKYNNVSLTYQAVIQHRNSETTRDVKMEWMQPLHKSSLNEYNSVPKMITMPLEVSNLIGNAGTSMAIKYRHSVFQLVRSLYNKPEEQHEHAYALMKRQLSKVDEIEAAKQKQLEEEQLQFQQAMKTMMDRHKPIQDQPRKRRRYFSPMPNPNRDSQILSVKHSRHEFILQHIQSQMFDNEEHLFTFPFRTTDSSLHTCFNEGFFPNEHVQYELDENSLLTSSQTEPIIVTSSTMKSLSPGNYIEDSVIDMALNW